ncbi:sensor histidine kinase [Thermocoleostomius sinensis]|uniref:histidine kinase n=1 Tax=Thermocoleostomius sinensis A174 TaxID=2016057 RepID=A0A9E8ZH31_9CYAN|nr:MASE1 domain-containing protein [Thermocoleostomius sinensis]WAL61647.1 MASE1 domain-containing protein [Thermocoleostomius sinensis A174]
MQPGIFTRVMKIDQRRTSTPTQAKLRCLVVIGTIALAYLLTARLSLAVLNLGSSASPVWPPAGIALAALVWGGQSASLGVALGALLSNYTLGVSWQLSAGSVVGTTLQAIVGESLLRRYRFRSSMERLSDVLSLAIVVLVSPLVNATIGTLNAVWVGHFGWDSAAQNWWTIWLGDGMGILVVTPCLLTFRHWLYQERWQEVLWRKQRSTPSKVSSFAKKFHYFLHWFSSWAALSAENQPRVLNRLEDLQLAATSRSQTERWLWLGSLIAVSWIVFYSQPTQATALYPIEYFPFPFVMWAALRFGQFRAVLASFILSVIAISGTILDRGPFNAKATNSSQEILLLQAFIGVITITALILAAVMATRQAAERQLHLTAERNRLLSEMAMRIRRSLDLHDILQTTVEEVRQFLQADRVFFSQFDAQGQAQVVAESVAPGWTSTLGWTCPPSDYQEIQALFAQDPIKVAHDTAQEEISPLVKQYHERYQVKAGMAVPILLTAQASHQGLCTSADRLSGSSGPQLLGLLVVNQCSGPRQWQPLEIELLEQLGTQVAIAIQQGKLYQQVQDLNTNLEQQVTDRTLQLQANMTELEELNQLRDVFIHAIAHDLRTTVMGSLMVLKNIQNQPGDEKVAIPRNFLERMIQSGEIQLCKLNSLLEAYKNKTEGIVIHSQPVALPSLIETILSDLKAFFDLNQAQVINHIPADLPNIIADWEQLERVFRHLLVNAVKHNPPGVQVILQATVEGDRVRCIVADNGKGISSSQCERLFDLSIGNQQERQLTGISLGLYLCQQIVTAHGGKIGVTSQLGKGSQFWLMLPCLGSRE